MEFFIICILFIVEVCRLNGTLQAGERNPPPIFYSKKITFFVFSEKSAHLPRKLHRNSFSYYAANNACKRGREAV